MQLVQNDKDVHFKLEVVPYWSDPEKKKRYKGNKCKVCRKSGWTWWGGFIEKGTDPLSWYAWGFACKERWHDSKPNRWERAWFFSMSHATGLGDTIQPSPSLLHRQAIPQGKGSWYEKSKRTPSVTSEHPQRSNKRSITERLPWCTDSTCDKRDAWLAQRWNFDIREQPSSSHEFVRGAGALLARCSTFGKSHELSLRKHSE